MGFEYGYSIANGDALVCWEGQFGDFVNGAQVVVDQFIAAGEDKWEQASGLVLLLPHGYEGQGPEHSSARLERFLTLAAEDNLQVAQPTTAAQYFHLLRRQMLRSVRKPLVVMTPKSLLRSKASMSPVGDLESGHFRETLDDPTLEDPASVKKIVLCSGKIAYPLSGARDEAGAPVAIVRLEQLYPFPDAQLNEIFGRYPGAKEVAWVQDEPANMGGWMFIHSKLTDTHRLADGRTLTHVARHESGSPAAGSQKIHEQEQQQLLEQALSL
jgi:2-oxoglutarate dehydrogenase E1 component